MLSLRTPEIYAKPLAELVEPAAPKARQDEALAALKASYEQRGWSASVSQRKGMVRVIAVPEPGVEPFDYLIQLCQAGRIEEALECLEALNAIADDADTAYNFGIALSEMGRLEEALSPLKKCLRLDPQHAKAAVTMAALLVQLEQPDEAEKALRAAVKARPDNAVLKFNLATLLANAGRLKDALPFFRQAASLDPHNPAALVGLARCLDDLDAEYQPEASRVCRDLIKRFPDSAEAATAQRLLEQQGQGARSVEGEYLPAELTEKFGREHDGFQPLPPPTAES